MLLATHVALGAEQRLEDGVPLAHHQLAEESGLQHIARLALAGLEVRLCGWAVRGR